MRQILTLLFALLLAAPSWAADKDGADVFARYECQRQSIIVGDSILVNVVIYSNAPFRKAECNTKNPKIKGGTLRLLPRRGERQQQRVRLSQGVYYAIVWDSYMVSSTKVEEVKFPELQFTYEVEVAYGEEYYDPFDPFGFFHAPRRQTRPESGKVKCPAFNLPIIEKPKRSTQDAISSGSRIA